MTYSQKDEEKYINDYFKEISNGRFLEIGGYNPFIFSNTRKLYERGWEGVILEPSPICMQSFIDEYKNEPRIKLIDCALMDFDGEVVFYESNGDAVGTTDKAHMKKWSTIIKYKETKATAISPDTLFTEVGTRFDFLSLDVEGCNFELLKILPVELFESLYCVCIEHDNKQEEIKELLAPYGFKEIHFNGENLIMGK